MRETGKVVRILDGGKVEVEMSAAGGCTKCGLCKIGLNNRAYMVARTKEGISTGDYVEVELKEGQVITITFLIFIAPLLIFFAGYLVYKYILAFSLLLCYLMILWFYDRDAQKKGKYLPIVVRKL